MKLVTFTLISLVGPTLSVTSGQSSAATHAAALDENRGAANFTFLEETGFPSPPAIIQSVRRLVRHLGRSMGVMATKSRRATKGCKEECRDGNRECLKDCREKIKEATRPCITDCVRNHRDELDKCKRNCNAAKTKEDEAVKYAEQIWESGHKITYKKYLGVNVPGNMDCVYADKEGGGYNASKKEKDDDTCEDKCGPECQFLAACLDITENNNEGQFKNDFYSYTTLPKIYQNGNEPAPEDMFECDQKETNKTLCKEEGLCAVRKPLIVSPGAPCGKSHDGRPTTKITVRMTYKCNGDDCFKATCHIVKLTYEKGSRSIHEKGN